MSKFMAVVAVLFIISIIIPMVSAETLEYCLNDTHKFWQKEISYNNGTHTTIHTFNYTQNCTYSCNNGLCMPAPNPSHDISVVAGLILAAFFFLYGGIKLDKATHGVIQVLFLFVGLLFIIVSLAALVEISSFSSLTALEAAVENGYMLSIYVFWFVLFYFIVLLFYRVLVSTGKIRPVKWGL